MLTVGRQLGRDPQTRLWQMSRKIECGTPAAYKPELATGFARLRIDKCQDPENLEELAQDS